MGLFSLEDLFVSELRDLYSVEKQIANALPRLVKAVSSSDLRDGLHEHLEQTREQITRLERILERFGRPSEDEQCKGMKGLLEEVEELMSQRGENVVIDAGLIAAIQKVEHYEIAAYGTVRAFADRLGQQEAAALLEETLEEEKEADRIFSEIAMAIVNEEAAAVTNSVGRTPES